MKTSRIMSALTCILLAGALSLTASSAQAAEYELTTSADDGGFDYWGDTRTGGSLASTGVELSVGNTLGNSNPKAVTILMFDLSSFTLAPDETIQSVELSYYLTNAWGSTAGTVSHSVKETAAMNWNADITSGLLPSGWETAGTANANMQGDRIARIDVTSWLTADLDSGAHYSAFRIVQADVYGAQNNAAAWGFRIASSENTSGYLVPTLTIITRVIPEPAHVSLLLGTGMLAVWLALRRRARC
ncbi:PEP-CTERM putative exosortase interaction domain-containing protein [Opitutaceae bacterium TAV1]|nr:PEP-CTERM putative exosortase interaction domain-containing protein [Opitutaceae bacterium TAV1]